MTPAPEIMFSLVGVGRLVTTMVVLAREESSDMSLGEVSVLASALLGELVALLLAILTGVLVATLELTKLDFNLSNYCCMFSFS